MMGQKLKVRIKWKQNECFVSKELFAIVRKQTSKGLILGLKNKYWIVVRKKRCLIKLVAISTTNFIEPREH